MSSATAVSSHRGLLYVVAMIVSGTLNTVFSKMQYGVRSRGTELCADPSDPVRVTDLCAFDKPWFSALLAKIGMSFSFVYVVVQSLRSRRRRQQQPTTKPLATETSTLLPVDHEHDDNESISKLPLKTAVTIAWPSLLDLLQTLISNVGLLWVSSSVYQMARGSVIIFSALVSVQFLRKHLHAYHYTSIAIVTIAVALVGWAGMPHEPSTGALVDSVATSNALLGLALIILAQFITAVQIVAEEYIMNDLHVRPLVLVGVEGLWGLLFYVVLIPVLMLTPSSADSAISKIWHEDFYDSIVKISNSNALVVLSLLNIAAVAALGPSANYVTKHLSGVMRSISEVLRTLGVWIVGLFVFYVVNWRGVNSPGEAWTVFSWIELVGFVLMVYGTLAYKMIIVIPVPKLYGGLSNDTATMKESIQKSAFA